MCTTATAPRVTFAQMIASAQAAGLVVAHLIRPDMAIVPSATERDTLYILTRLDGAWVCNCPATGRCWHQNRAAQLARAAAPAPVDTQARYRAALADVFGEAA